MRDGAEQSLQMKDSRIRKVLGDFEAARHGLTSSSSMLVSLIDVKISPPSLFALMCLFLPALEGLVLVSVCNGCVMLCRPEVFYVNEWRD